jgi:hypothetical protein
VGEQKEADSKQAGGHKQNVEHGEHPHSSLRNNEPRHRTAPLPRPIRRTRSQQVRPRNWDGTHVPFVSTRISIPRVDLKNITSYRSAGQTLWYPAPGSTVMCDGCGIRVPLGMGALQGARGRSQFAQCEFWCTDCMSAYG